ncbi:MAG: 6-phosphogluconolactonase [Caulobacteraceae bacterium]
MGLRENGTASFAATGGGTPIATYDKLAVMPLLWEAVSVALTDERWVNPSSPESNEGMVRAHLLTGEAKAARMIPLWSAGKTPEEAAAPGGSRDHRPPAVRRGAAGAWGDDGHIASMFPRNPVLEEAIDPDGARLCLAVPPGKPAPPIPRVTLTLRALLATRSIIILIQGEAKRRVIEAARGGADLPVRCVLTQDRAPVRVLWSA